MLRLALLLMCLGLPALAGPWPRGEGQTFLSFSLETEFEHGLTDASRADASFYAERGLAHDLTLGLDAGGDATNLTKAIVFLRWPLALPGKSAFAMDAGIGARDDRLTLRAGLSYGRALEIEGMPGWLSIDSQALFADGFDGILKTDLTLGIKPRTDRMMILQLQTGAPSQSSAFAKLAPSWVIELAPGRHLELGVVAGIMKAEDLRLKIGLWHSF